MLGLGIELVEHQGKLLKIIRKTRPDLLLEVAGTFIVHAGFVTGTPSLVFYDTEHAKLSNSITYPFASRVITPECYQGTIGRKQIRYAGYQELAYLHPNQFQPDPAVLDELGLATEDRFFVLRFVSWGASHDVGHSGFSQQGRRQLVEWLAERGRVIISAEGDLPADLQRFQFRLPPEKIHDVLAFATLFIGEGGTMATEAALLGTPSIFVSTLEAGTWSELRDKYELLYFYSDEAQMTGKVQELLSLPDLEGTWQARRARVLADKIDVTEFLVDYVESFQPHSYAKATTVVRGRP
jgi:predicted glycosyltransferase